MMPRSSGTSRLDTRYQFLFRRKCKLYAMQLHNGTEHGGKFIGTVIYCVNVTIGASKENSPQ
jgi:hypothetical protein